MVFGSCDGLEADGFNKPRRTWRDGCGRGRPYDPFASTVPDGRCSLGIGNRLDVRRYG